MAVFRKDVYYVFIAKDNQPSLAEDIRLVFENRQAPDYSEPYILVHGRIEPRSRLPWLQEMPWWREKPAFMYLLSLAHDLSSWKMEAEGIS